MFICYKETDDGGRRTPDSVLAQDLYYQLTQEGFKVFFSRITLEDKLGSAYEPYIFAALNSAKVMVVLGTKPEYFEAVWVKNEWSRYLGLIKNGANKMLVPAYRDMDPYNLPEEFSHLQAQDMGKLGFMQDLTRGIRKIVGVPQKTVEQSAPVVVSQTSNNSAAAPLLRRAGLFLENGDWENADVYCEKVLDIEPENAAAYIYKLMAARYCAKESDLGNGMNRLQGEVAYNNALRFADDKMAERLISYDSRIKANIEQAENERREREERVAREKAEREEAAKARLEEMKRQREQQEEERRKQKEAERNALTASEAAKNLKQLQKKRNKAVFWCIVWILFFWPIAIYSAFKIKKLSDEISEMEKIVQQATNQVGSQENIEETSRNKKDRRIGMKIGMIVSLVYTALFGISAAAEPAVLSVALFCLVFAAMFYLLSRAPRKSKYMYFSGKESTMKKAAFVFLSIIVAFVVFVFFCVTLAG